MATDHHKLEAFSRSMGLAFNGANGATSTIAYMHKDLTAQEAIEYLKQHHGSIQTDLLRASQAFRELKKVAGIPEDAKD